MNRSIKKVSSAWLAVFSLLIAIPGCQGFSREAREADLLSADRARMVAMVFADEGPLYLSLHNGLTYIHSNGDVDSKDSLMDAIILGRVDYRVLEPGPRVVGLHGQMGVITGPIRIVVAVGDRVIELDSTYTAIYWWEGNRWQLATYRSRPPTAAAHSVDLEAPLPD